MLHTPVMSALMLGVALPLTYLLFVRFVFRKPSAIPQFTLEIPGAAAPYWKGKRAQTLDLRSDDGQIKCICPATGQLLGYVAADDAQAINAAVTVAKSAQQLWAPTFEQRYRVLMTIQRYLLENQLTVARVACRDTGKTTVDAALGEIMVTLEKIKWIVKNAKDALATQKQPGSSNPLMFYKGAEIRYQPLGVVCAMVSWNYPLHNMMGPIAAAIMTGNAAVVKCSEQVAWSSQFFVQIARRALELEGHDPNLVQLVCCWPEDADTLTQHPDISHITFIGSQPVAHKVVDAAAKVLTPVVCELGGKDPLIVLNDAKRLEDIASIVLRGTFQSSGQNCIGVERVIACGNHYDSLVQILTKRVPQLRLGSSLDELTDIDMGAMISEAAVGRIEALVEEAVQQGARLLCGGRRFHHPKYPVGVYFEPTLLADVTPEMTIAQEEVFGPVLVMMKAENADEALMLANSTQFGLGASVFGSNYAAVEQMVDGLRCGNVAVNDFATYHLCQLPFGGVDGSGYGKFGGVGGLRGLCIEKSVCYDKYPFISTFIPKALDYPLPSMEKAWTLVESMQEIGYGTSIWTKIHGIRRMTGL